MLISRDTEKVCAFKVQKSLSWTKRRLDQVFYKTKLQFMHKCHYIKTVKITRVRKEGNRVAHYALKMHLGIVIKKNELHTSALRRNKPIALTVL